MPKVEHLVYGDRKVFTVSAFNRGIGMHLGRLPAVWVEGEVTELRRNDAWANVFVTLKGGTPDDALKAALKAHVRKEMGALADPDDIRFTAALPKTRSGKIMRRLLRDIAAGKESTGDTSTLEDFSVLAKLRDDEE